MEELSFEGRVAIVTGAGRGIGRSHALLLADRGARVVVADLGAGIDGRDSSNEPAEAVAREIESRGGRAVACHASVADEESAASIVSAAIDAFGRVDVLVNNAGIHDPGAFAALSAERHRAMIRVHHLGTVFVTRAVWPHFIAAGYGRIVNTVSEAMLGGIPELSSYGAAKGAVFGLTRNLATEGAPHGIRVNAIAPRAYTRMAASHSDRLAEVLGMPKEVMDSVNASMPPELCAPAAAFLAHERCPLDGEVLLVGMNHVARIAVVESRGYTGSPLTVEDIAENLDDILDLRDARLRALDSVSDEASEQAAGGEDASG